MIQHVDPKWVSATKRGVRMFIITLLAMEPGSNLLGAVFGSQPVDVNLWRSVAFSCMTGLGALAWRAFLDPLPVKTLSDTQKVSDG